MASPLPTGAQISVVPQAPRVNPAAFEVNPAETMQTMNAGLDLGGRLARLGDMAQQIKLEQSKRKAEMAQLQHAELLRSHEAELIPLKMAEEKARIDFELKHAEEARLAALQQQQAAARLSGLNVGEAEKAAGFRDIARAEALKLMNPAAQTVEPAPAQPSAATENPFVPNADLVAYRNRKRAEALSTGEPSSILSLDKNLGLKREKREFVKKNGEKWETDVLVGPEGQIFKVEGERFQAPSDAQKSVDQKFADDIGDFNAGGKAKAQAQIDRLDAAIKVLRDPSTSGASGPFVGLAPEFVKGVAQSSKTRGAVKDIEQVIQQSLKLILGSQFAAKEAEQLLARSFDPYASEESNAARLETTKNELQAMLNARSQAVDFFREHGTLSGFAPAGRPANPLAALPAPGAVPQPSDRLKSLTQNSPFAPQTGTPEIRRSTKPITLPDGRVLPAGTPLRSVGPGQWVPVAQ